MESLEYDILIVGAGPAGLATAIRLKQLSGEKLSIAILEKGSEVGAHLLSGAVIETATLKQLLPNTWQNAPLDSLVTHDSFYYLTPNKAIKLPTPKPMHNHGNHMVSLSKLGRFLGAEAESLGCDIFPGFAAVEVLFNEQQQVIGVKTDDKGIDKHGNQTEQFQPGIPIYAKQTIFAEGTRGQLSQQIIETYQLDKDKSPQTYGLGIKEIWEIPEAQHQEGQVIHTIGWPLSKNVYGGSFIYHMSDNKISLGFVVGLDYENPWLSPYEEFQQFKRHPMIQALLKNGKRLSYGARALYEGGLQSQPKLTFPGGLLVGDSAGFLNVPKIKGIHMAMQAGMLAAESIYKSMLDDTSVVEIFDYQKNYESSNTYRELYIVRNIRPGFRFGLMPGLINAFIETYISRGNSPWTLKNVADNMTLKLCTQVPKIEYPKPDGVYTFDKSSSVYLTNTHHDENQPCHLQLLNQNLAIDINYKQYASPETRYCPAGVYEIIEENNAPKLQINAQNCIQCKTCDIKDPEQNIKWVAPEGGSGPNYQDL